MNFVPPLPSFFCYEFVESDLFIPPEAGDRTRFLMKCFLFPCLYRPLVSPINARPVGAIVDKYGDAVIAVEDSHSEDLPPIGFSGGCHDGVPSASSHGRRLCVAVSVVEGNHYGSGSHAEIRKDSSSVRHRERCALELPKSAPDLFRELGVLSKELRRHCSNDFDAVATDTVPHLSIGLEEFFGFQNGLGRKSPFLFARRSVLSFRSWFGRAFPAGRIQHCVKSLSILARKIRFQLGFSNCVHEAVEFRGSGAREQGQNSQLVGIARVSSQHFLYQECLSSRGQNVARISSLPPPHDLACLVVAVVVVLEVVVLVEKREVQLQLFFGKTSSAK